MVSLISLYLPAETVIRIIRNQELTKPEPPVRSMLNQMLNIVFVFAYLPLPLLLPYLPLLDPPRNITFVSNITDNLIINEGYVGLTCSALANPPALYTMKEYIEVLYSGPSKKYTTYLDNIYHSNIAVFRCEANNTLGSQISRSIEMRIINGGSCFFKFIF